MLGSKLKLVLQNSEGDPLRRGTLKAQFKKCDLLTEIDVFLGNGAIGPWLPLADLGIEAGTQCPLPSPPLPPFLFHPIASSLTPPSFPLPLVQLEDLGAL